MTYQIERADNGYIVTGNGVTKIFTTLDGLLSHLLLMFEGRSEYFGGQLFGQVMIIRKAEEAGAGDE